MALSYDLNAEWAEAKALFLACQMGVNLRTHQVISEFDGKAVIESVLGLRVLPWRIANII